MRDSTSTSGGGSISASPKSWESAQTSSLQKNKSGQKEEINDTPNFCLAWSFLWERLTGHAPPGKILMKQNELAIYSLFLLSRISVTTHFNDWYKLKRIITILGILNVARYFFRSPHKHFSRIEYHNSTQKAQQTNPPVEKLSFLTALIFLRHTSGTVNQTLSPMLFMTVQRTC